MRFRCRDEEEEEGGGRSYVAKDTIESTSWFVFAPRHRELSERGLVHT